jgi:DNA replicative helicase MCM subunit Mcm2 (Cdc46/Mcm family)
MVQVKTTIVTVNGQDYQVRKMTPVIGSYIWQLLMAACFKASQAMGTQAEEAAAKAPDKPDETTPADKLRGLCGIAFMQLDFDKYEFIQTNCMKVVSHMETLPGGNAPTPMALMTWNGTWAEASVADDLMLVTRLMTEALVFSLSSFLAPSGTGA